MPYQVASTGPSPTVTGRPGNPALRWVDSGLPRLKINRCGVLSLTELYDRVSASGYGFGAPSADAAQAFLELHVISKAPPGRRPGQAMTPVALSLLAARAGSSQRQSNTVRLRPLGIAFFQAPPTTGVPSMTTHERSATELATEMTNLLAGFQISQALYAVAKLDIPAALLDGPHSVTDLATQAQVDPDLLRRILHVLTGQGVFTHAPDDAFALTELGATLATGTTGSVRGLATFWMETHYQPFSALLDVLRTGRTGTELVHGQTFVEFLGDHPEHIPSLTAAMADMTSGPQSEILSGYRLPPGIVADIGGADGSVLVSLIADEPDRHAIVFDLPDVVESARTRIADTNLTERIRTIGGNFFESVPKADVYLLATVLHDWNDEDSLRILKSIRNAARPAARLVIVDIVLPDGDEPHLGKITDLTMLTVAGGRERTRSEFATLLTAAGFNLDRVIDGAGAYSIIEATLQT